MKRGLALFSMATVAILLSAGPLNAQGRPGGPPPRPAGPGAGPGSPGGMGRPDQSSKPVRPEHGVPTAKNERDASAKGQNEKAGVKTAAEHLAQNEKLSARMKDLLPAGTDVNQAAAGFKNLGQFVAAAHASKNLGVPFDQVKSRMVDGKSLGEAIRELRPDVDHRAEEKKANKAAQEDIEGKKENPASN